MKNIYSDCHRSEGNYDHVRLAAQRDNTLMLTLEAKLSAGSTPDRGGVLSAPKVTLNMSAIRGPSPIR